MFRTLTNLIAAARQTRGRRPPSARPQPARLNVEALEGRLVLSVSPLVLPTAGGGATALRCVHGYKWRPPPGGYGPRDVQPGQAAGQLRAAPQGLAVAVAHLSNIPGETAHLLTGAADGPLVVISGNGHLVPPPPPVPGRA
jgi:hypothetical protein